MGLEGPGLEGPAPVTSVTYMIVMPNVRFHSTKHTQPTDHIPQPTTHSPQPITH